MDVNEFMIDRALDLLGIIPHITTIIHAVNADMPVIVLLIPTILVTGPVLAINPVVVIF